MRASRVMTLAEDANLPLPTYLYLRAKGMSHKQCKVPQVPTALSPLSVLDSVRHYSCIIQVGRHGFAKRIADAKYPLMPGRRGRMVTFTCGDSRCINPHHIMYPFVSSDVKAVKRASNYLSFEELARRYYVSERFIKDTVYYS